MRFLPRSSNEALAAEARRSRLWRTARSKGSARTSPALQLGSLAVQIEVVSEFLRWDVGRSRRGLQRPGS